jgi:hypothetical protein
MPLAVINPLSGKLPSANTPVFHFTRLAQRPFVAAFFAGAATIFDVLLAGFVDFAFELLSLMLFMCLRSLGFNLCFVPADCPADPLATGAAFLSWRYAFD